MTFRPVNCDDFQYDNQATGFVWLCSFGQTNPEYPIAQIEHTLQSNVGLIGGQLAFFLQVHLSLS